LVVAAVGVASQQDQAVQERTAAETVGLAQIPGVTPQRTEVAAAAGKVLSRVLQTPTAAVTAVPA
jgi:hypothetical protein